MDKTEDNQQRQARLDPARTTFEEKLQACAKQQGEERKEFDLRKEIEDCLCPASLRVMSPYHAGLR